nr:bifunctional UDP-sugar hydrolase/5'-nucleotidase [Bacillus tianshenii]
MSLDDRGESEIVQIRILHTNDIHSHFDAYPKIAAFLKGDSSGIPFALVDIGDNMDRFHPITEATQGQANTSMLNLLKYDYATIGNNEGITLDYQALSELYRDADFQVLVANLFETSGEYPGWVKHYAYKQMDEVRVCFIGLSVYYQHFYELLGWKLEDPYSMLEKILPEVRAEADAVVVLSHLGISDDEEMARRFPEIDVILGGHTHHVLPEGKMIGNTLVCGAGKYGQFIGEVTIGFNEQKGITVKTAKLHSMDGIHPDNEVEEIINKMEEEASGALKYKLAELQEPMNIDWFAPSPLANLLAEALKEWCEADIGMVNAGVLLESIPAGAVTRQALHRICPHPINPCRVTLTGEELREVLQQAIQPEMEELKVKGLGFRGKVMGRMAFSGLEMEHEIFSDGSIQVKSLLINGKEVKSNDAISIGTIDMFTFGRMYPSIVRAKDKKFYMPELLRDVLAEKLSQVRLS